MDSWTSKSLLVCFGSLYSLQHIEDLTTLNPVIRRPQSSNEDVEAMECHAEGAKLSDSVELSASVAALRKVPGGEQVGCGGSWGGLLGLVGFGGVFYTKKMKFRNFHSFTGSMIVVFVAQEVLIFGSCKTNTGVQREACFMSAFIKAINGFWQDSDKVAQVWY